MPSARFATITLPLTRLQQIINELERQRSAIETALAALRGLSADAPQRRGPGPPPSTRGPGRPPEKRSNISEEGRQRIAEALRKRWAAKRAAAKNTGGKNAPADGKTASKKRSAGKKTTAKKSAAES